MKFFDCCPGREYVVRSVVGCDVAAPDGRVLCVVPPGGCVRFEAFSYVVTLSDDGAQCELVCEGLTVGQALGAAQVAQGAAEAAQGAAEAAQGAAEAAVVARDVAVEAREEAVVARDVAVEAAAGVDGALRVHEQDPVLHVGVADRKQWDAAAVHVGKAGLHVTAEERVRWDEAAGRDVPPAFVLTADAVKAVVPMNWESGAPAAGAVSGIYGLALGGLATVTGSYGVAVGMDAKATGARCVAVGGNSKAQDANAVAVGGSSIAEAEGVAVGSSAVAKLDCVALGCAAKGYGSVAVGYNAASSNGVAVGKNARESGYFSAAVGDGAVVQNDCSAAFGGESSVKGEGSMALGYGARAGDDGVAVVAAMAIKNANECGVGDMVFTQLYLIAAGSPLSVRYCGGEAGLGFVTTQEGASPWGGDWSVVASGTRRLADLLTDNRNAFEPDLSGVV